MKQLCIFFLTILTAVGSLAQPMANIELNKTDVHPYACVRNVRFGSDSMYRNLYIDPTMFEDFWDTIPQTVFWQKLMYLSPDTGIFNVASDRKILFSYPAKQFASLSEFNKNHFRDSIKRNYNIPDSTRLFFTTGKKYFYHFKNVIPNIDASIPVFIENQVDPWYAQSILLIESPNKLQKSNAGAYGPFQLMKYVAQKYGHLKVNKNNDERGDVRKSAFAASNFIKLNCIPSVKGILDSLQVQYCEDDLWFKLLVMHVYHAGSGNVKQVLYKIRPTEGGMSLIYRVWQTEAGSFRNASQNYSQVLLAALREFHGIIRNESTEICSLP